VEAPVREIAVEHEAALLFEAPFNDVAPVIAPEAVRREAPFKDPPSKTPSSSKREAPLSKKLLICGVATTALEAPLRPPPTTLLADLTVAVEAPLSFKVSAAVFEERSAVILDAPLPSTKEIEVNPSKTCTVLAAFTLTSVS
jgi:hypothetical protein